MGQEVNTITRAGETLLLLVALAILAIAGALYDTAAWINRRIDR